MELSLETSQIPHLICFSFNLNSSFFAMSSVFSFLGNVEHFERTWRIICGRNDEYSGSIPTFSRSFCMWERVKILKKGGGDNWLVRDDVLLAWTRTSEWCV